MPNRSLMNPEALIAHIVQQLQPLDGLVGIALGGSHAARGTHTSSSDIDLGLYYDPAKPPISSPWAKLPPF